MDWAVKNTSWYYCQIQRRDLCFFLRDGTTDDIVKYDAEGKRADLVEKKNGLVSPHCIACDDEDNIYCIDYNSNKIQTCDGNGNNLQIHEVELEKECRHGLTALAITDQKLFMAELEVLGIIKVYNKQLQHLSTIKHKNMFARDISLDIHQNIYVSDMNNSCVHVFTKDGLHLRSIGHDNEELKSPFGLCVHGQYVYVTDDKSHCVFVFTTDGEYVTCLVGLVRMRDALTLLVILVLMAMVSVMLVMQSTTGKKL